MALWWCGQNFVGTAPASRATPSTTYPSWWGGGGEESHDWGNLLTMLDAVDSYALARASFTLGILVMLAALGWGAYLLKLQHIRMSG